MINVRFQARTGRSINAYNRTLEMAMQALETGHSLTTVFPVSPPSTGHFRKSNREQAL